jgi:GTP-binding protein
VIQVPVGTIVRRAGVSDGVDLSTPGMHVVVARGGEGGKGNARMATSTRRAPRIAERGLAGESVRVRLELRLLAEAGLVGLPNAGKSSLLRAISSARPKVGAYPFTTLEPHLGVVERGYESLAVADIPGLIEGAHEGAGLGVGFLQHIRRTRVLVHVIDTTSEEPLSDLNVVREELRAFGHGLVQKPWLVAVNKVDLPGGRERAAALGAALSEMRVEAHAVSALTGEGVEELLDALFACVRKEREREAAVVENAPEAVLRVAPARRYLVQAVDGMFVVSGEAPERAVAKLGVDSEEAKAELSRRLARMGVAAALRRAKAKAGDKVRIGEAVLEWPL